MHWITEENYDKTMTETVEPFLARRRMQGFDERIKGQPIYYEHYAADNPHGIIVISHGFTESIAKFSESIYYMLQAGFDVWGVDHRGHGRSWRENVNPMWCMSGILKTLYWICSIWLNILSYRIPTGCRSISIATPWVAPSGPG